jgi:ABC-type Fe3+-citrate transport system substrate-binding protein
MKLKNILTFLLSLFIFIGCSTVEKSEFLEERDKKLDSLKEECDFVTVEYSFPDDIYICHKTPSRIRDNKSADQIEESNKGENETD